MKHIKSINSIGVVFEMTTEKKPNFNKPICKTIGGGNVGSVSSLFYSSKFGKEIIKEYGESSSFGFEPLEDLEFENEHEKKLIDSLKINEGDE